MAITPTYPGVYIQELPSAVHPITGVATSIGAFVGYTARGIDNRAEQIFSFSDYERLFGGLASNSELSYAVQQFFANGGNQAYVVRVPRTGALGAQVVFGGLTFTALSSGIWADGALLIDVDLNGLTEAVPGTLALTNGSATVTGTSTSFTTTLEVGQWLVFASDTTATAYQITAIASDTSLTLGANYAGSTISSTTAVVIVDQTAFNLTITNLVDGTVESFPNVSLNNTQNNYVANVVNDLDNGSQLVNVQVGSSATAAPTVTGIVGTALVVAAVDIALGGSAVAGTVALTNDSATVTGTGTSFTTSLTVNQWVVFASDATQTPYQINVIASDTSLTLNAKYAGPTAASTTLIAFVTAANNLEGHVALTNGSATVTGSGTNFKSVLAPGQSLLFGSDTTLYQVASIASDTSLSLTLKYAGATNASATAAIVNTAAVADFGIQLNVSSPAVAPSPLPISIKVFAKGAPIPQTVSGLAAQLQKTINAALTVQMPGAFVQCSVAGNGTSQAVRVNATLPQFPDAVLTFSAPPTVSLLFDASHALGLSSPSVTNVAHYALGTGNNWQSQTSSTPGSDGSGLPGTGDLIGDQGLFTGIYALQRDPTYLFNLLCIPDATRAMAGNPAVLDSTVDPNAIYSAAIALCDSVRALLLLDPPPYVNTVSSAVDWKTSGLTVSDPNGAAFFPRLRLPDPLNNYNLRTFAPCGVVAGLYARIDATRGVFKAPAGIEATLSGVQSLVYKLSDAENGVLNPLGLNCFRTFPVYGSVLWGARTLVGADADANQWKYVPVRRVALFLESSLYQGTQWVVFEPNDEPLWSAIRLNVGSFMQDLFRKGYFQGQTPAQAYFVKCDSETTTQTDIDNGIVNIVVGFAPLQPAEFVIIQIQQMAGQTAN